MRAVLVAVAALLVAAVQAQQTFTCTGQQMVCIVDAESAFIDTEDEARRTLGESRVNHLHQGFVIEVFDTDATLCKDQLVLPLFLTENSWSPATRAIIYGLGLIWFFLGIALVADRFMASIEVITSTEKTITFNNEEVTVLVWNETVANLTLMALGSSAPEIMLAVVETSGDLGKPPAEDSLGPSTIVGSAAFNLFIIIGLCVIAIPPTEVRRIKEIGVFSVTAVFSVLAYVWMLVVLEWNSKNEVELWEALVTLMLFPLLVLWAYLQDQGKITRFLCCCCRKAPTTPGGTAVPQRHEPHYTGSWLAGAGTHSHAHVLSGKEIAADIRRRAAELEMTQQRASHAPVKPVSREEAIAKLVAQDIMNSSPRRPSIAYHMVANARRLGGGRRLATRRSSEHSDTLEAELPGGEAESKAAPDAAPVTIVDVRLDGEFEEPILGSEAKPTAGHDSAAVAPSPLPVAGAGTGAGAGAGGGGGGAGTGLASGAASVAEDPDANDPLAVFSWGANKYSVMEDAGTVKLALLRTGNTGIPASVEFATADGTARDGEDYHAVRGTVSFEAGQVEATVEIPIIDDNEFEPDENFYVGLYIPFTGTDPVARLGRYAVADVTIIDDDNPGEFTFELPNYNVKEDAGVAVLSVVRRNGGDGTVRIHYSVEHSDSGAKAGVDYEDPKAGSTLIFNHGEVKKEIRIPILPSVKPGRDAAFTVQFDIDGYGTEMCGARYGEFRQATVTITDSEEFAKLADKIAVLVNNRLEKFKVGTNTWGEQFKQAMTVGGDDDDDDDGEEGDSEPPVSAYILHIGTFFWKVVFAFIPPTSFHGGWWAFVFSLAFIGLLTSIVGDLASVFGCTIGLTESVTALTFVALGTSLPDTFASKSAACNDENADASIGNVTGSNSVNVFLGLGLPWTIAAVYHVVDDTSYMVPAGRDGALAFGVGVFCACAVVGITTIYIRRCWAGGELGGNRVGQWVTFFLFVSLWVTYVVLASLSAEGKI